ncbi:MAG: hypothetical protein LBL01_07650 [Bifidobacteriaceae bacterium]|jgi:hypothetical protein|nr:hypothetical protein [Bifidobacteriaceae bacterium]
MPTTRDRIQVTVTEPVAEALAAARSVWPQAPRSEQIARLMEAGASVIESEPTARLRRRRQAAATFHGSAHGVYQANYLDELRSEWSR